MKKQVSVFGLHARAALNRLLPTCQIIYLTGYLDYAPDAYATRHTYYVYRPTMEKHLPLALQKAMTALAEAENGQLVLPQKGEQLVLEKQTILYMERRLRVTKLYLADGQCVTTALRLEELLERLGDPAFLRCHNSFAVSLDHAAVFRWCPSATATTLPCGSSSVNTTISSCERERN